MPEDEDHPDQNSSKINDYSSKFQNDKQERSLNESAKVRSQDEDISNTASFADLCRQNREHSGPMSNHPQQHFEDPGYDDRNLPLSRQQSKLNSENLENFQLSNARSNKMRGEVFSKNNDMKQFNDKSVSKIHREPSSKPMRDIEATQPIRNQNQNRNRNESNYGDIDFELKRPQRKLSKIDSNYMDESEYSKEDLLKNDIKIDFPEYEKPEMSDDNSDEEMQFYK